MEVIVIYLFFDQIHLFNQELVRWSFFDILLQIRTDFLNELNYGRAEDSYVFNIRFIEIAKGYFNVVFSLKLS